MNMSSNSVSSVCVCIGGDDTGMSVGLHQASIELSWREGGTEDRAVIPVHYELFGTPRLPESLHGFALDFGLLPTGAQIRRGIIVPNICNASVRVRWAKLPRPFVSHMPG